MKKAPSLNPRQAMNALPLNASGEKPFFLIGNRYDSVALLSTYTAGTFDLSALMGPVRASCRAHIASVIDGKRVPQSKAGVTALRAAFYLMAEPVGDCLAAREGSFIAWCKRVMAERGQS
jgi:hypothetical protein